MKKYWIIVNGQPQGPFTPDEIAAMGVASPVSRVWFKGLTDWVPITQVPELAQALGFDMQSTEEHSEPVVEEVEAEEVKEEVTDSAPKQSEPAANAGLSWGLGANFQPERQPEVNAEPMPQTYLPWNVLATICCCLPAGIIGIIFSARVSRKYNEGDLEGARKASEVAAWCLMLSIVLGLVCWPFQMLFNGL